MPRCNGCHSVISASFARVFGNNDDEVSGCPHCCTEEEIRRGIALGVEPAPSSTTPIV